jgi:hypothetical protein
MKRHKHIKETGSSARSLQIVRPELNIEKWPIFVPSKSNSKTLAVTKVFQQDIPLPDGRKQIGTVKKVPTAYGDLTTEDLVIYYALIAIWNEEGRPKGKVRTSLHRIAKVAGKQWGQSVAKAIKNSLYRLTMTTFIWEKSFYDAATDQTTHWISLGKDERFSILDDLHIHEVESGGRTTTESSYFRFHARILKNLLENHTRPVLLSTLMDLKSDIAKLLYRYIDRVMAYKLRYERRSKELFEELGLEGKTYAYRSKRKEKLVNALGELRGAPLTTGTLTRAEIVETADKDDFKVIFVKTPTAGDETIDIELTSEDAPSTLSAQAKELAQVYHHHLGHQKHRVSRREIGQVTELLETYGEDFVEFLIDYAIVEARRTSFSMRWFGATLQYVDEAVAAFYGHQNIQAESQPNFETPPKTGDDQQELYVNTPPADKHHDLQQQFEALSQAIQDRLRTQVEQQLAAYKQAMKPDVYAETYRYALYQAMAKLEES